MKQIISLTIAFLAMTVASFAQTNRTMLKVRLNDESFISVNLDGRFINKQTRSLTLDGIRPGLHRLEVYSNVGNRRRPVRIYTGTLRLRPGTVNIGIVDVNTRGLRLRTRAMDDRDLADRTPDGNFNRFEDEDRRDLRDSADDVYNGDRNDRHSDDVNSSSNTGTEGYGSYPRGRDATSSNSRSGFSKRDMDDLKSRVSARITDSDKEELMKSVLQSRTMSTDQVRTMLAWLSFESTRLDFAKWAYEWVSDRQNYWKLEGAFDFSSSKKEFSESIKGR